MKRFILFIFCTSISFASIPCIDRIIGENHLQALKFAFPNTQYQQLESLNGTMNDNYLVSDSNGKKFVFKVLSDGPDELFSRSDEKVIHRYFNDQGIAPHAYFFKVNGFRYQVVEYIDYSSPIDFKEDNIIAVSDMLCRIHGSNFNSKHTFNLIGFIESQISLLVDLGLLSPEKQAIIQESLSNYNLIFEQAKSQSLLSICHNDLNSNNILSLQSKVFIIDWELSAMNDPAWEIAYFILINRLNEEQQKIFLDSYMEGSNQDQAFFKGRVYFYQPYVLFFMAHLLSLKIGDLRVSQTELRDIITECLEGAFSIINSADYGSLSQSVLKGA